MNLFNWENVYVSPSIVEKPLKDILKRDLNESQLDLIIQIAKIRFELETKI